MSIQFKDRIKLLRCNGCVTQTTFAKLLNKTEGAIRAWESGKAKPDVDTLIKLSQLFECTTDYLLGLDNYKNKREEKISSDIIKEFTNAEIIKEFNRRYKDPNSSINIEIETSIKIKECLK